MRAVKALVIAVVAGVGATVPSPTGVFHPVPIFDDAPLPAPDPTDALIAQLAPPDLRGLPRLASWATHYSVPRLAEVREGVPLLDPEGRALGPMIELSDFCRGAMAGTFEVALKNGKRRLYRYETVASEAQVDCSPWFPRHTAIGRSRFRPSKEQTARLAGGEWLVPFRSLAVDPRVIPLGSVVYIPAARGTVVSPEGGGTRIHDGYFYAVDTGGAIEGEHIDVFLGFAEYNPFIFVKSDPRASFDAYVIHDLEVELALAELHGTLPARALAAR